MLHNGRHVASLSDPCPALSRDAAPLVPARTRHERFGWLNDAFATDVARLVVDGAAMIEIVIASTPGAVAQATHPRVEVSLRDNADLVLVERHVGGLGDDSLVNVAIQVHAAPGSRCRHLRWQALDADAQLLDTLQVALDTDAHYSLALLQLGSRSARSSVRLSLYGRGAQATMCGVSVAGDKRTIDTSLLVDHIGADTTSAQTLRALARDRAQLAWRSRVEVTATARGTSCEQSLKGLLNNPGAEIDLRPQLEIHTDAVRASHGATTGALDQNMLFYLLSRGLDADTARGLLEWAFCEDAIRLIDQPLLRRQAELALADYLGNKVAHEALAHAALGEENHRDVIASGNWRDPAGCSRALPTMSRVCAPTFRCWRGTSTGVHWPTWTTPHPRSGPSAVLDAVNHYETHLHSNVHRGVHTLSQLATDAFEAARERVRRYINAASTREIVFVRGTTEAINLVAQSWGRSNLQPGDEILISQLEHHANIVPWQMAAAATGARLRGRAHRCPRPVA